MLFSVNQNSNYKDQADEIRCEVNQLGSIYEYAKEHQEKRYMIEVEEYLTDTLMRQLELFIPIVQDYTISCSMYITVHDLLNQGYKAYYAHPVSDWETYNHLRELEVSDILLSGSLAFSMNEIKRSKGSIKIRIDPNMAHLYFAKRKVQSFYIRPEDLYRYDYAVDIAEFRDDTSFTIYKRGTFVHDISSLIPGLPQVNNALLDSCFGQSRVVCQQKCQTPGHVCHVCDRYFSIANKTMELIKEKK